MIQKGVTMQSFPFIDEDFGTAFQKKYNEWFVLYNPLFFFSAFCMVFGVYLVSKGLRQTDLAECEMLLPFVMESYQFLLLGGTALLFHRAKQYRPAAILGILTVFFLPDCTLQTELMASFEHGVFFTGCWILLAGVKLTALIHVFRLKVSKIVFAVPLAGVAGIGLFPHLFWLPKMDAGAVHLAATWYGVILACLIIEFKPEIECRMPLQPWGRTVLRRAVAGTWAIWAGIYFYHLCMWLKILNQLPTFNHLVPFLLIPMLFSKKEKIVWIGCAGAVIVSMAEPSAMSPTAIAVGFVFGFFSWRMQKKRLLVGMILSFYTGIWVFGCRTLPPAAPPLWLNLAAVILLFVLAFKFRIHSAGMAVLAGVAVNWKKLGIEGALDWGIFLVAVGFAALICGVAINFKHRDPDGTNKNNEETTEGGCK